MTHTTAHDSAAHGLLLVFPPFRSAAVGSHEQPSWLTKDTCCIASEVSPSAFYNTPSPPAYAEVAHGRHSSSNSFGGESEAGPCFSLSWGRRPVAVCWRCSPVAEAIGHRGQHFGTVLSSRCIPSLTGTDGHTAQLGMDATSEKAVTKVLLAWPSVQMSPRSPVRAGPSGHLSTNTVTTPTRGLCPRGRPSGVPCADLLIRTCFKAATIASVPPISGRIPRSRAEQPNNNRTESRLLPAGSVTRAGIESRSVEAAALPCSDDALSCVHTY